MSSGEGSSRTSSDVRHSGRVAVNLGALVLEHRCFDADGATITELSMSGAVLRTQARLRPGTRVRVVMKVTPSDSSNIDAVVSTLQDDGFGVHFLAMDEESRRLVTQLVSQLAPAGARSDLVQEPEPAPVEPPRERAAQASANGGPGDRAPGIAGRVRRMLGIH